MKLDYDFLKEILTAMEEFDKHSIKARNLSQNLNIVNEHDDKFAGHLLVLRDINCIDMNVDNGIGHVLFQNGYIRITAQGYQFLDALRDDTFFNKIKGYSIGIAQKAGETWLLAKASKLFDSIIS